jgi:hypothetical protein
MSGKFFVGLRETYGVTFFIVKLEATQLDYLTITMLNYWNFDQGLVEMYGLIVALLLSLFYIMLGYHAYRFAANLWSILRRESVTNLDQSHNKDIVSQNQTSSISDRLEQTTLEERYLVHFESHNKDGISFMWENVRIPDTLSALYLPLAVLGRSFLLAIAIVVLSSSPLIQIITAAIIELCYLYYIIKYNIKASKADFIATVVGQLLLILFLVLKCFTIPEFFSEKINQNVFGNTMGWIVIAYGLVGILFAIYSLCLALWISIKKVFGSKPAEKLDRRREQENPQNITGLRSASVLMSKELKPKPQFPDTVNLGAARKKPTGFGLSQTNSSMQMTNTQTKNSLHISNSTHKTVGTSTDLSTTQRRMVSINTNRVLSFKTRNQSKVVYKG